MRQQRTLTHETVPGRQSPMPKRVSGVSENLQCLLRASGWPRVAGAGNQVVLPVRRIPEHLLDHLVAVDPPARLGSAPLPLKNPGRASPSQSFSENAAHTNRCHTDQGPGKMHQSFGHNDPLFAVAAVLWGDPCRRCPTKFVLVRPHTIRGIFRYIHRCESTHRPCAVQELSMNGTEGSSFCGPCVYDSRARLGLLSTEPRPSFLYLCLPSVPRFHVAYLPPFHTCSFPTEHSVLPTKRLILTNSCPRMRNMSSRSLELDYHQSKRYRDR